MQEHISEFIEAMRSEGIGPSDPSQIVADDTIRRYHIEGDKPRVNNGVYKLTSTGDFAYAWFISHKEGITHKWNTKSDRKWSAEEKAEHKCKLDAAKRQREEQQAAAAEASRVKAKADWDAADRDGISPYLDRKGVTVRGVRYEGDTLIVPMWRNGELVSVQRIYADGSKYFPKGSNYTGAYFSIRGDIDTIAICEGIVTGQVIHNATGWSVIAAFNAGNLKPVAIAIRAKYPNARIVFTADNDHENERGNVGIDKAQQAAVAIGGAQVIAPPVDAGESDWDDVARRLGIDAVRDLLTAVPTPEPEYLPEYDVDDVMDYDDTDPRTERDPYDVIRPLGHNRGEYYFFPRSTGQIMSFSATALGRMQNLYQLAPKGFWERMFAPEDKPSVISDYASAVLIAMCQDKGIFSAENVRGVGAWRDGGKLLVNCGDVIVGEGVRMHPAEYDGVAVYEAGPRVIDLECDMLGTSEAAEFRSICKSLTWKRPQYGDMLAGWCVLAAVGSVLTWRPHIVVSGQRGSGKSTVMDAIIKPALGRVAIARDGGTTEAGLRKAIGASGRPVVMDEAESEEAAARAEMAKILFLIRKASSGATIENANATFVARSCFCLAAINPRIEQGADRARFTQLELVPNKSKDAAAEYATLLDRIRACITDDFHARLLARTVAHLDVLLHNADTFGAEISKVIGDKRSGDQIGPMLAGAYLLTSTRKVTAEFAAKWIAGQSWDWHDGGQEQSDAEALVSHLMAYRVRYDQNGMGRESTIGEMVWRAAHPDALGHADCVAGLGTYGIKVKDGRLIISNSAMPLKRIFNDTPWGVWRRTLSDYEGADNWNNKPEYFGHGITTKATSIPLDDALGRDDVGGGDEWIMEGFDE